MRPPQAVPAKPGEDTKSGFLFALSAYGLWGFMPLYFKAIEHLNVVEMIAHRIVWSVPVAAVILVWLGRTADIIPTLKDTKKLGILFVCALIISLNWGIYVWAITVERTVETALGYYINPLITVAMGAVLLGERFDRLQMAALALATLAVVLLTVLGGQLPWISLVLAFSFAGYAYLRKTVEVGPTQGFLIEVLLLSVIALPILGWFAANETLAYGSDMNTSLLLMLAGPYTALPLILYAAGAKRLRLSTIGLMQYTAPTIIFLISVFHFKEPFSQWQLVAFIMIWIALALYSWSLLRVRGKDRSVRA